MPRVSSVAVFYSVVFSVLFLLLGPQLCFAETSNDIGPLPAPPIPPDNPMSEEKVELGKLLFFDPRLSGDSSLSCASCHLPEQGWSTNTALSPAYPTNMERRNSPTLINVAYNKYLIWDGRADTLENQALGPIKNPLHMNQNLDLLVEKLKSFPEYVDRFGQVFGTQVSTGGMSKALAAFQRTITTSRAPFDRYMMGDTLAMPAQAVRGMELFKGKARCIACHNGPNFSDGRFHNLGVPKTPIMDNALVQAAIRFDTKRMGITDYQQINEDLGRFLVTKAEKDKGAFKTPTLRNVPQTAPYMHNGALQSLEEVIEFYNKGEENVPGKSVLLQPLGLGAQGKGDLLAFLHALTGDLPRVSTSKLPH